MLEVGVAMPSPDWPYPRGDVWILRYRGAELDDGVNCTTGRFCSVTEANIDSLSTARLSATTMWLPGSPGTVTHDLAPEPPGS